MESARPIAGASSASLAANGLEIGYDVLGAGPPLVMLHGASSLGREDYGAQLPSFGKAFRCYLPDARGHGRTRWDAGRGLDYDDLVADLLAFVDGLGLATFHLVGFSMGAATALGFAARHTDRLRTLVVVGMAAEPEPRTSVIRRIADVARVEAHDPAWAATLARRHDASQGPGSWRRLLPAIVGMVERQARLRPADLHGIDAPTMVVVGDRDPFVPVDQAWRLSRQVPAGRLFVAPDCGHEVTARRPILFNEACAGFYRATEAVAAQRASSAPGRGADGGRDTGGGTDGGRDGRDGDRGTDVGRSTDAGRGTGGDLSGAPGVARAGSLDRPGPDFARRSDAPAT